MQPKKSAAAAEATKQVNLPAPPNDTVAVPAKSAPDSDPQAETLQPPPEAEIPKPPPPQFGNLGPYQLLEKLGEGGMGAVYKARHTKLGRIMAVKVLSKKTLQEKSAIVRFEREMLAVGKVEHPNVVQAFDAGEVHGRHYLAMEYVEGDRKSVV